MRGGAAAAALAARDPTPAPSSIPSTWPSASLECYSAGLNGNRGSLVSNFFVENNSTALYFADFRVCGGDDQMFMTVLRATETETDGRIRDIRFVFYDGLCGDDPEMTPSACLARVRCSKTDYDDIGDVYTCPARAF